MTIYILKGYPASQNKMLIICMNWIKGFNYEKINSTHQDNSTNKC